MVERGPGRAETETGRRRRMGVGGRVDVRVGGEKSLPARRGYERRMRRRMRVAS